MFQDIYSCYLNKMDLLTNARVISDAVQLINTHLLPMMEKAKQDNKDKNVTANTIKDLEEKDEKDCINSSTTTDKTSSAAETEEQEDQAEQQEQEEGVF